MATALHDYDRPLGLRFVVDVVNEVKTGADWRRVAKEHGGAPLGGLGFDEGEISEAITLVRTLFAETNMDHAAEVINQELVILDARPELVMLTHQRWALRPRLDSKSAAHALRLLASHALAEWATERGRCAWGICNAPDCTRVFIDEGRRQPQRYCSTTCATRARVATHRKRHQEQGQTPTNHQAQSSRSSNTPRSVK